MDRRQFLKGIIAVMAVPVVAQLPAAQPEPYQFNRVARTLDEVKNPIFKGELGRYDGVKIIESRPFDLRDEYGDELGKWWAKKFNDSFFEMMTKNG